MPRAFTLVEILACFSILAALFAGGLLDARAFTIVEIIVFGVAAGAILFLCIGLGYSYINLRQKTKTVVKGNWLSRPAVIPSAPQSATLVYHVTRVRMDGKVMGNVTAQSVTFTLTPVGAGGGSVTIVSVTDAIGGTNPVGGLTATGVTDPGGKIVVTVSFEQWQSGMMTAADTATGSTEPSDTFLMTAH